MHRPALRVRAQRVVREVDGDGAGKGIGHAERRRRKVRGPHLGVDAAFEVAVAREDSDDRQVPFADCRRHVLGQRARVADAGGAAVPDEVEPELVEVGHQPGGLEVVGDHPRPGRQARLHPWLGLQSRVHGLLGEQAGSDHHRRVGRVGAARDRGDDHRAVAERCGVRCRAVEGIAEGLGERPPHPGQGLAVLGPAGAGKAGLDGREIEIEDVVEDGVRVLVRAEQALLLRVGLDEVAAVEAPRLPQVVQRPAVHRKQRGGGSVLGTHVGEGRPVLDPEAREAGAEELDKAPDHPPGPEELRQGQHQVRGGGPRRKGAAHPDADHRRPRQGQREAEHRCLRLDASDPPSEDAQAVDHRRVRVGAEEGVGEGDAVPHLHHLAQVLQVDLVADPHAWRHHP